jgi:hypothetical protein
VDLAEAAANDPQDTDYVIEVALGKRLSLELAARLVPHYVKK